MYGVAVRGGSERHVDRAFSALAQPRTSALGDRRRFIFQQPQRTFQQPQRTVGCIFGYETNLSVDYEKKLSYRIRQPRSLRASSGDILKAERGVASCGGGS